MSVAIPAVTSEIGKLSAKKSDTNVSTGAATKLKRSRSGCLSCRKRHKKCDECKPICNNCQQRNAFCEWPIPKKQVQRKRQRRSIERTCSASSNHSTNASPGTNYHQILNNEISQILTNLNTKQNTKNNNSDDNNSEFSDSQSPVANGDSTSSRVATPSRNISQSPPTLSTSSLSLLELVNLNLSPEFTNQNINNSRLTENRKSSISSNCSSVSSTPSLFSHKPNKSSSNKQPTERSSSPKVFSPQITHPVAQQQQQFSSPIPSGASSPSSISYETQEDLILKKFQFMAPSHTQATFDSRRFRPCNDLFHDFLFSIIALNKERDFLKSATLERDKKSENKQSELTSTAGAIFLTDFNLCLEQEKSQCELREVKSRLQRSKEQYYSVLSDRSNTIFQQISPSTSSSSSNNSNSPIFDNLYRQFTFSNFQRIATSEEKNILVQQFLRNVIPLLNISTFGKNILQKLITSRLARSANNYKVNIDDHLICSILAISSRISDLQKVSMSFLLSRDTNEELVNLLGDRKDRTISLFNKSIALLIDTMKSTDFSQDPFISLSKTKPNNQANPNETVSLLISCVLLFLVQLTSTPAENHRVNLKALLMFIKSFQISAFNDANLLHGISKSCKIAVTQLFWFLVRLDISYSLLFKEVPILNKSKDFFSYIEKDEDTENDMISMAVKNKLMRGANEDFRDANTDDSIIDEVKTENYGNYLCYLATRVLCLLYSNNNTLSKISTMAQEEYTSKWKSLEAELYQWFDMRPLDLKSIVNNDRIDNVQHGKIQVSGKSCSIQFPILLFHDAPSTQLNQLYHALNIAMLQHETMNTDNNRTVFEESKAVCMILHAVKIIGISLHDGNVSNGVLSLPFASTASSVLSEYSCNKKRHLVNSKDNCDLFYFSYDCKPLLKKLLKAEQKTGWPLSWKFGDF